MTYKPGTVKGNYDGPQGIAMVKVSPNGTQVAVKFEDQEVIKLSLADCYEDVRECIRPGKWMVKLTSDKKQITSIRPISGMARAKFEKFVAKKDSPPVPLTKPSADGSYSWLYFIAIFKITAGEAKGMRVSKLLSFNFQPFEEEVTLKDGTKKKVLVVWYSKPKSRYTPELKDFCETMGVWQGGPILWSDNPLPQIEKRILRADKEVSIIIKEGYIDTFYEEMIRPEEAPFEEENIEPDLKDLTENNFE